MVGWQSDFCSGEGSMDSREQAQAFKEMVGHTASADGADVAFEMLVRGGWTVCGGQGGTCPSGFRIFAMASWERRVLIRDSDGSFWALEMKT